jgi:hypothetical protein
VDAWTPAFGLWHLLGLVSGARLNAKHTAIYLSRAIRTFGCVAVSLNATASFAAI